MITFFVCTSVAAGLVYAFGRKVLHTGICKYRKLCKRIRGVDDAIEWYRNSTLFSVLFVRTEEDVENVLMIYNDIECTDTLFHMICEHLQMTQAAVEDDFIKKMLYLHKRNMDRADQKEYAVVVLWSCLVVTNERMVELSVGKFVDKSSAGWR